MIRGGANKYLLHYCPAKFRRRGLKPPEEPDKGPVDLFAKKKI